MAEKKGFSSTSEVLQTLFQNSKSSLGEGFTRWKLWREWEAVVGRDIANHSTPVGYRRGVLYVWVDSSPRMQEISFLAGNIIYNVNRHLGKKWIRRIQFTLDRKEVPDVQSADESLLSFVEKHK